MDLYPGRRVYGADHDDPDPGPLPGHLYRQLAGGPLDGSLLDVTGWTEDQLADGALLITEHGHHGPGGRADYGPPQGDPLAPTWVWLGDVP